MKFISENEGKKVDNGEIVGFEILALMIWQVLVVVGVIMSTIMTIFAKRVKQTLPAPCLLMWLPRLAYKLHREY